MMPQLGSHIVIAERTIRLLTNGPVRKAVEKHLPEYYLGSVAPDMFLFLFDPVGHSDALNSAMNAYRIFKDVKEVIEEVGAKAMGPVEDFANWVTGELYGTATGLISTAFAALKELVVMQLLPGSTVTTTNPFAGLGIPGVPNESTFTVEAVVDSPLHKALRSFGHPYTSDPPFKTAAPPEGHKGWWWVDVAHYRRTGPFAHTLLGSTQGDDVLTAFSAGYFTHVAGDVCGHPFVNSIVGGPFRNHALRHMVIENVIEAWVWDRFKNENIAGANLQNKIDVGGNIDKIIAHLLKTMQSVWVQRGIRPGLYANDLPTDKDLKRAYQTLLSYLELSTDNLIQRPAPPPGSPQEFFQEIASSLGDTLGGVSEAFSGNDDWWEWLLAPFIAAAYGLVFVFKLLTLPAAVLVRIATLYPRWLAYYMMCALCDFIQNARWTLALSGLGKVSSEDLSRPLAQAMVRVPPNRAAGMAFRFPYRAVPRNLQAFWLQDPSATGAGLEPNPQAESCPYRAGALPEVFIDGAAYNAAQDALLKRFAGPLGSPLDTVRLERATFTNAIGGVRPVQSPQFGNAPNFAKMLIEGAYPASSFDMDADKGYGFQSWKGPDPRYDAADPTLT